MLIEVKFLRKISGMDALPYREIYDAKDRSQAWQTIVSRYGAENVFNAQFKELEANPERALEDANARVSAEQQCLSI